jgi:flavin-dependent dehydrogenase
MSSTYDAVVVGARCAGSPTAMLLARRGYRVLLVDKATFPSDTMSTHLVHPPGVAALKRWGLLERLVATGCPPITTYRYDFGPLTIAGSPRSSDGVAHAYCPRRIVLDELLVEAAVAAGAELREGFDVDEVLIENGVVAGIRGHARGGPSVTERACVVIGADGRHSLVAKALQPERYHEQPTHQAAYYAYWSDLPVDGLEVYIRTDSGRGWGVLPTHDGLTCVIMGWPRSEFDANRKDVEGNYMRTLELVPEFAERARGATRATRFVGTGDQPNFYRKPYGPGWALVGDAGFHKDSITAQGISDAFRDAELLADALDQSLSGGRTHEEALAGYQRMRDAASLPMFELTCELAKLEPPPPEMLQLLGAASASQVAMDDFASAMAGTLPIPEFFAPENVARIVGQRTPEPSEAVSI